MVNYCKILFIIISFCFGKSNLKTFNINNETREYYLYTPSQNNDDVALVFMLHGYTGSASTIMHYSKMNNFAEENGFFVCYPQGLVDSQGNSFWNVGYDFHKDQAVSDVEFLSALAKHIQDKYNISSDNTFSAGMSNGGEMSYMLGCQASDVFSGIASVTGIMFESFYKNCNPLPIPVLEIHGTEDDTNWWIGDPDNKGGWGNYIGIEEGIDFWKNINHCTETAIDTFPNMSLSDSSFVIAERHLNKIDNNAVWLYRIVNGGHDWPGSSGNMDINASQEIWNFFRQYLISD